MNEKTLDELTQEELEMLMEMMEDDDSEEFPLPPPSVYYELISEKYEVQEDIKPKNGQQKKKKRKNQN